MGAEGWVGMAEGLLWLMGVILVGGIAVAVIIAADLGREHTTPEPWDEDRV